MKLLSWNLKEILLGDESYNVKLRFLKQQQGGKASMRAHRWVSSVMRISKEATRSDRRPLQQRCHNQVTKRFCSTHEENSFYSSDNRVSALLVSVSKDWSPDRCVLRASFPGISWLRLVFTPSFMTNTAILIKGRRFCDIAAIILYHRPTWTRV